MARRDRLVSAARLRRWLCVGSLQTARVVWLLSVRYKRVMQVFPTSATLDEFFGWMRRHQLGRNRILDTLLAATFQGRRYRISTHD